jgi:hypothetical protein
LLSYFSETSNKQFHSSFPNGPFLPGERLKTSWLEDHPDVVRLLLPCEDQSDDSMTRWLGLGRDFCANGDQSNGDRLKSPTMYVIYGLYYLYMIYTCFFILFINYSYCWYIIYILFINCFLLFIYDLYIIYIWFIYYLYIMYIVDLLFIYYLYIVF